MIFFAVPCRYNSTIYSSENECGSIEVCRMTSEGARFIGPISSFGRLKKTDTKPTKMRKIEISARRGHFHLFSITATHSPAYWPKKQIRARSEKRPHDETTKPEGSIPETRLALVMNKTFD